MRLKYLVNSCLYFTLTLLPGFKIWPGFVYHISWAHCTDPSSDPQWAIPTDCRSKLDNGFSHSEILFPTTYTNFRGFLHRIVNWDLGFSYLVLKTHLLLGLISDCVFFRVGLDDVWEDDPHSSTRAMLSLCVQSTTLSIETNGWCNQQTHQIHPMLTNPPQPNPSDKRAQVFK